MPSPEEFLNQLEDVYRKGLNPKMVLVSFPHNPTTQVVEKDFFETIVAWVDAGTPEGDPADLPEPPVFEDRQMWQQEEVLGPPVHPGFCPRTRTFLCCQALWGKSP